jgi:hypothetical protein
MAAALAVLATAGVHIGIRLGARLHGNGMKQGVGRSLTGRRRAAWRRLLVGTTRHGGSSSRQRHAARDAAAARRQRRAAGVTSTWRRLDSACLLARHGTTNFT